MTGLRVVGVVVGRVTQDWGVEEVGDQGVLSTRGLLLGVLGVGDRRWVRVATLRFSSSKGA